MSDWTTTEAAMAWLDEELRKTDIPRWSKEQDWWVTDPDRPLLLEECTIADAKGRPWAQEGGQMTNDVPVYDRTPIVRLERSNGRQRSYLADVDDPRIETRSQARLLIGELAERYAATLLGGRRLQTQAGAVCPDLQIGDGWAEVKSLRSGSQIVLRDTQIRRHAQIEASLVYVIIEHHHRGMLGQRRSTWAQVWADAIERVLIVPARLVHRAAVRSPESGGVHRIPYKRLDSWRATAGNTRLSLGVTQARRIVIEGGTTPPVRVYRCKWNGEILSGYSEHERWGGGNPA